MSRNWRRRRKLYNPRYDNETRSEDRGKIRGVFAALRKEHGFICRMRFWCCMSCGCEGIEELAEKAKEKGQQKHGWAFFHQQDETGWWEYGCLYLAYGDIDGGQYNTVQVGKMLVKALKEQGLTVEWNGKAAQRILVKSRDCYEPEKSEVGH